MDFRFKDLPRAIWYFFYGDRKKFITFAIILNIVLLSESLPPYIIGRVVNFLTNYHQGDSMNPLIYYALFLAIATGIFAFIRLECKKQIEIISVNARYRAKTWGFQKLVDFSLSWHQQESTGNKAQRLITGSEAIRQWVIDLMNVIFPTFSSFLIVLVTCVLLSPIFAIFFIYYFVVLVMTELYFDRKISLLSDTINKAMENASGRFVEGASNITSVKALGAGQELSKQINDKEQLTQKFSQDRVRLGVIKWQAVQWHNAISWGMFLFFVGYLVINQRLSIGLVTTYTMYFARLREGATRFTNQFQLMIEQKSNLGRMMNIFWTENTLKTGEEHFPPKLESIQFNKVQFAYQDKTILKDITFGINQGQIIGMAGESGSGKSTIFKLLLGLYHPNQGQIHYDALDLTQIKQEELTKNISIVLQETELFAISLVENVTMGRNFDPLLFDKACHIANLTPVIEKLPRGRDTILGEKGYSLSGGERQRIGIARAIYLNPQILLMDECTSALDAKTEESIMSRLLEYQSETGMTIIMIAHNVKTLAQTHKILLFDQGRLVRESDYQTLLKEDERFNQKAIDRK
ncbi:ABC transporter ATP-binding protein [Spirochaeta cellobiosiphila]|uniref:ABC transporter ATP-binding protein n=1 Tax=Spirochaeta cellobiosiphila TaxID=504483 RepID=UPI00040F08A1|nr:ABC transporter ATP-binding protein [Spirochaeta cellobiosiphila]